MKVSKARATENRDAILKAAAAQIRERGFDDVSVAGVGKAAGLTHGALYSHFKSKDSLQAEAIRKAFDESLAAFSGLDLTEFGRRYLSPGHRDHPGTGCPNAALVSEVWRQPPETQEAFRDGIRNFVEIVDDALDEREAARGSDRAVALFAMMVGGLALSRAVAGVDGDASDAILRAVSGQAEAFGKL